jgi:hypothetical protein
MMDSKQLATQLRLDGVKAGLQRIRVAFLVINIAAIAMIISEWNAYFSRSHNFLSSSELSGSSFVAAVQRENIGQILQTQRMSVALLGISVRVEDFAVLGSLGMLVCALWLFFGLRGYHDSLCELLEDTCEDTDLAYRRLVAHGIDSFMVFSVLRRQRPPKGFALARILWYIPAIVIAFIVIGDFAAAFWRPAARGTVQEVLQLAAQSDPASFFRWEIGALVLALLAFWICRKTDAYDKGGNEALKKYFWEIPLGPNLTDEGEPY